MDYLFTNTDAWITRLKNRSLLWLLEWKRALNPGDVHSIYIGDEKTDEDVFVAFMNFGFAVIVEKRDQSSARYYIEGDCGRNAVFKASRRRDKIITRLIRER